MKFFSWFSFFAFVRKLIKQRICSKFCVGIFFAVKVYTEMVHLIYFIFKEEIAMVQIIAGKKGKGKTKHLLDMANAAIKGANGTVVYLDKSAQHMYELNNRIRLINVNEFPVASAEGFLGFICGIISQDHDLETMYLDSFLKLSALEGADITETYETLKKISDKYHVTFVLSISMDADELPECAKGDVIISL